MGLIDGRRNGLPTERRMRRRFVGWAEAKRSPAGVTIRESAGLGSPAYGPIDERPTAVAVISAWVSVSYPKAFEINARVAKQEK